MAKVLLSPQQCTLYMYEQLVLVLECVCSNFFPPNIFQALLQQAQTQYVPIPTNETQVVQVSTPMSVGANGATTTWATITENATVTVNVGTRQVWTCGADVQLFSSFSSSAHELCVPGV